MKKIVIISVLFMIGFILFSYWESIEYQKEIKDIPQEEDVTKEKKEAVHKDMKPKELFYDTYNELYPVETLSFDFEIDAEVLNAEILKKYDKNLSDEIIKKELSEWLKNENQAKVKKHIKSDHMNQKEEYEVIVRDNSRNFSQLYFIDDKKERLYYNSEGYFIKNQLYHGKLPKEYSNTWFYEDSINHMMVVDSLFGPAPSDITFFETFKNTIKEEDFHDYKMDTRDELNGYRTVGFEMKGDKLKNIEKRFPFTRYNNKYDKIIKEEITHLRVLLTVNKEGKIKEIIYKYRVETAYRYIGDTYDYQKTADYYITINNIKKNNKMTFTFDDNKYKTIPYTELEKEKMEYLKKLIKGK